MTFNATTIASDILCPAFFHVLSAEGFTTSKAFFLLEPVGEKLEFCSLEGALDFLLLLSYDW